MKKKYCEWVLVPIAVNLYDTQCGHLKEFSIKFSLTGYKYCPYCGRKIKVVDNEKE